MISYSTRNAYFQNIATIYQLAKLIYNTLPATEAELLSLVCVFFNLIPWPISLNKELLPAVGGGNEGDDSGSGGGGGPPETEGIEGGSGGAGGASSVIESKGGGGGGGCGVVDWESLPMLDIGRGGAIVANNEAANWAVF